MLDFLIGNDALSAIVAFGLVLIPAIFIHELGHFLAAKAVGITVLEFGIGFPPRMVKLFTIGATEYTLNWLPIGGFVRPLGEDFISPVAEDEEDERKDALSSQGNRVGTVRSERDALRARGIEQTMTVNEATPAARILFMSAGALANLLTALVLFVIIGMSGLPTIVGISAGVAYIEPGSTLDEAGLQVGDVIQEVNGAPFISGAALFEQLQASSDEVVTLAVQRPLADNRIESLEIGFIPEIDTSLREPSSLIFISAIASASPAETAGIQSGDIIVAFDGEPFTSYGDLPQRTQARAGQEITLTLRNRDGERDVTLVPRVNPPEGQGAIGIVIVPAYGIGNQLVYADAGPYQQLVNLSAGEAISYSASRIGFFLETLLRLPGDLIGGVAQPEDARLVSPLGISQLGAVFLQQSIQQDQPVIILNYIAIISIALGITQLLPLPMLDGGRILFVLLEIVRGRPVAPEREGMVHLIGFVLLLSLMAIAFLNDIINPITSLLP